MGPSYIPLPHVSLFMNKSGVSEGVFRLRLAVCTVLLDLEENFFITLDPDQANRRAYLTWYERRRLLAKLLSTLAVSAIAICISL
jgi:hypothetical protein